MIAVTIHTLDTIVEVDGLRSTSALCALLEFLLGTQGAIVDQVTELEIRETLRKIAASESDNPPRYLVEVERARKLLRSSRIPWRIRDVAAELEVSTRRSWDVVNQLVEDEQVSRVGRGLYLWVGS